jgi:hypothetical protein
VAVVQIARIRDTHKEIAMFAKIRVAVAGVALSAVPVLLTVAINDDNA